MEAELFKRIVDFSIDACNVEPDCLISSNRLECVDARVIMVNAMVDHGETEGSIANLTGMSQQRVNYLKNSIRNRMKRRRFRRMIDSFNKNLTKFLQEEL